MLRATEQAIEPEIGHATKKLLVASCQLEAMPWLLEKPTTTGPVCLRAMEQLYNQVASLKRHEPVSIIYSCSFGYDPEWIESQEITLTETEDEQSPKQAGDFEPERRNSGSLRSDNVSQALSRIEVDCDVEEDLSEVPKERSRVPFTARTWDECQERIRIQRAEADARGEFGPLLHLPTNLGPNNELHWENRTLRTQEENPVWNREEANGMEDGILDSDWMFR